MLRVRLEPLLRVRWRRLRRRAEASRAEASAMAADAAEDSLLMAACYLNGRVLSVAAPAPTDHGCAQGVPTFAAPPCRRVMLVIIAAPQPCNVRRSLPPVPALARGLFRRCTKRLSRGAGAEGVYCDYGSGSAAGAGPLRAP